MKKILSLLLLVCLLNLVSHNANAENISNEQLENLKNITKQLGHCTTIVTTFERLECFDAIIERYQITEQTNLQNIKTPLDIGKWQIKEETSDIDGQHIIYMNLSPENSISIGNRNNVKPTLVVRCITGTEDYNGSVYIDWDAPISKRESSYIKRRFERETPIGNWWTVSNDKKGTFYDKPLYLIQEFLKYKSFRVEANYNNQTTLDTVVYDLRGFDNVVRTVMDTCGWN